MASLSRSTFLTAAGAAAAAAALPLRARAAGLDKVALDFAYYNPPSLVLKSKGWLEETLAKRGTSVEWVLSLGSNKANQYLQAGGRTELHGAGLQVLVRFVRAEREHPLDRGPALRERLFEPALRLEHQTRRVVVGEVERDFVEPGGARAQRQRCCGRSGPGGGQECGAGE